MIKIAERKEYMEQLLRWKDQRMIKVVTGVRRCGKSMLLELYQTGESDRLPDGRVMRNSSGEEISDYSNLDNTSKK